MRDSLPAVEDRGDLTARIAIIGLGNSQRGDDAAGQITLDIVREQLQNPAVAFFQVEQPLDLVDLLQGYEVAFIVDACLCDLPAGQIVAMSWPTVAVSDYSSPSTHTMSLSQSLALAETLGMLPSAVRIFAISGTEFGTGKPAGDAVKQGSLEAAQLIVGETLAWQTK